MRILTISSLYPPDYLGGYEIACSQVMDGLRDRGHEVRVMTSRRRWNSLHMPDDDPWTHRVLDFAPLAETQAEGILSRTGREWRNNRACRRTMAAFEPDVITIWDFWGLLPGLLTTMERTGVPLTYAVSSRWAMEYAALAHRWSAFWEGERRRGLKGMLKRVAVHIARGWIDRSMPVSSPRPDLRRAFFCSRALRDEHVTGGWLCDDSPVIYHGVDVDRFSPGTEGLPASSNVRLLVSGRVVREKGTHVVVEALALLFREGWDRPLTLDIVGPQPDPDYAAELRRSIARLGLEQVVFIHPQAPREMMPEIYRACHALVFPSVWEEPFALTVLEAMACGVPVVGTITGGSGEVLEHGVTGLVFESGSAQSLARQLRRMLTEPGLGGSLAHNALRRVRRDFTIEQTVERVEEFLSHQVGRPQALERGPDGFPGPNRPCRPSLPQFAQVPGGTPSGLELTSG